MPHIFGPKFLRVRTPKTTDGKTLEYDENQQLVYSETNLPLTARKALERENERTPIPYRHKIEVIDENAIPEPKKLVKGAGISMENEREALMARLAELDKPVDPGPKEVAAPKVGNRGKPEKAEKIKPVVNHKVESELV